MQASNNSTPAPPPASKNRIVFQDDIYEHLLRGYFSKLSEELPQETQDKITKEAFESFQILIMKFKFDGKKYSNPRLEYLAKKSLDDWKFDDVEFVCCESLGSLSISFMLLFNYGFEFQNVQFEIKSDFIQSFFPNELPQSFSQMAAQYKKMMISIFDKMDQSQLDPKFLNFFKSSAFPSSVSFVIPREMWYAGIGIVLVMFIGNVVLVFKCLKKKKQNPYK